MDTTEIKPMNLATKDGNARYDDFIKIPYKDDPFGSLDRFIQSGITDITYKNISLASSECRCYPNYFIKQGTIRCLINFTPPNANKIINQLKTATNDISAIVLPTKLPQHGTDYAITLLLNGDDNIDSLVSYCEEYQFPTISFTCLGRFYNEETPTKGIETFAKNLHNGTLTILDYTPDHTHAFTKKELEQQKYQKDTTKFPVPTPPERGFTNVNMTWHRPATVLFYDQKKDMTILMGQDEGTYFGCQLKGNPKTIPTAYQDLIPEDLREYPNLTRQGEWFFVPKKESEVPPVTEAIIVVFQFQMPVENDDSNAHLINCDEGWIDKNGTIYAKNPEMTHNDHATVDLMVRLQKEYSNPKFFSRRNGLLFTFAMLDCKDSNIISIDDDDAKTEENYRLIQEAIKEYLQGIHDLQTKIKEKYSSQLQDQSHIKEKSYELRNNNGWEEKYPSIEGFHYLYYY